MTLGRIKDHLARATRTLTSADRGLPNIAALQKALMRQVQELEDVAWDIVFSRVLRWEGATTVPWASGGGEDTVVDATGASLDLLGALVGLPRQGRTDADYQVAVRLELRILRSLGTLGDVLAVARAAAPGSVVTFLEPSPAALVLSVAPIAPEVRSFAPAVRRASAIATALFVVSGSADSLVLADAGSALPPAANELLAHTTGSPSTPLASGVPA